MKIYSQLEKAQFECVASASPTPTPLGRVYADITAPTAALPRFYDGTAWREIVMSNTIASYSSSVTGIVNSQVASNAAIALTKLARTAPTVQRFTSGSGTYTTPANVLYIRVYAAGGGGGGAGGGTSTGGTGGTGNSTTFGSSLLTAAGGVGATFAADAALGGAVTVNSPAVNIKSVDGGRGQGPSVSLISGSSTIAGGIGGTNAFGGFAGLSQGNVAGVSGQANTGQGGQGGGTQNSGAGNYCGGGGGAGGYIEALISSPSATYAYSVGSGGAGGTAGTNGRAGGAGGSGIIIVEEFYV